MKTLIVTILILFAFYVPKDCSLEKGWNGIRVFETERAEVEKLLGKPVEHDTVKARYETDSALFEFLFSAEPCSKVETLTGSFRVSAGTVLQYSVTPKRQLLLDQLKWSQDSFIRTEDSHLRNVVHYWNKAAGIHFATNKLEDDKHEAIRTIYYERAPNQIQKFKCSDEDNG